MMDTLKIRIDSLSYGGSGVGRHEGIVYFVPLSAPGDLLEVRITRKEKRYREAEIISIIEPSPERVEPPCPFSENAADASGSISVMKSSSDRKSAS